MRWLLGIVSWIGLAACPADAPRPGPTPEPRAAVTAPAPPPSATERQGPARATAPAAPQPAPAEAALDPEASALRRAERRESRARGALAREEALVDLCFEAADRLGACGEGAAAHAEAAGEACATAADLRDELRSLGREVRRAERELDRLPAAERGTAYAMTVGNAEREELHQARLSLERALTGLDEAARSLEAACPGARMGAIAALRRARAGLAVPER